MPCSANLLEPNHEHTTEHPRCSPRVSSRRKPERARQLEEKEALARIEERMSLRHKNTSKWARQALKRGAGLDATTRKAVQEQLRLGQVSFCGACGGRMGRGLGGARENSS